MADYGYDGEKYGGGYHGALREPIKENRKEAPMESWVEEPKRNWSQDIEDRLADMEATLKLFKVVMNDVYDKLSAHFCCVITGPNGEVLSGPNQKFEPPSPDATCC